jgi:SAM-dependent methyltransferase
MRSLAKLLHTLHIHGLAAAFSRLRNRIAPKPVPPHPFDLLHGTDTGGLIHEVASGHPSAAHSTAYWGTAPSLLRGALARWAVTLPAGLTPADYTFLDVGSGKGRVLMLASELPFRRILGVELDPGLVAIAHANLALWSRTPHPCTRLETLATDILDLPLPSGPLLIYLFNPFNQSLMQNFADYLQDELLKRDIGIDILYTRPDHASILEAIPGIHTLFRDEIPFTPEDTAADIFATTQQQCFLYRLPLRASESSLASFPPQCNVSTEATTGSAAEKPASFLRR